MKHSKILLSLVVAMAMMVVCPQTMLALTDGWTQCGTCEYLIDGDGLLTIRPEDNGAEGALPDQQKLFYSNTSIKSVKFEGTVYSAGNSCAYMFASCTNLTSFDGTNFNTSAATDMQFMFSECMSLTSINVRSFNTSAVTDMQFMFYYCEKLTSLDLSSFDTSNVTTMEKMFYYCRCLTTLDLSSFNTSKLTDMGSMFNWCDHLTSLDLSSFDTSKVTDMFKSFYDCQSLSSLSIGNPDMSKVTQFFSMFFDNFKLTSLTFKSYPYLLKGTFNSLTSAKVSLKLDDNSTIYTGENYFPEVKDVSYSRSMKNTWGTLVLPFDIDYFYANGSYQLYYVEGTGDNCINIVRYTSQVIPAGTPLIVKKLRGEGISFESAEVCNFTTGIKTQSGDGWEFKGTYSALTDQTGMYYVTGDKFYHASSAITVPAFRAYLNTTSAGAKALAINVMDADGTTKIETIDSGELTIDNGEVFNLSGQRLSNPQKGINIINGKKIMVK